MRLVELSLRNYRVFEEVDLELPARVIGVFGPNGGGKSTLLESVLYALYGQARTPKNEIRTHGVLTPCEVRLLFEHGGTQYEVRRSIQGKNHTTDAEMYAAGSALAVGVDEVTNEVRRLLHMDQQVFRASVFAEQKQLDAFSDLTRTRRKEMVVRLLGIKPVDDARALARTHTREAKADVERLAASLPDTREQERALEGLRADADQARVLAERSREDLQEAIERTRVADESFDASDAIRQRADRIAAERTATAEHADALVLRVRELETRIARWREELRSLPDLETEMRELQGASERLAAGRRVLELTEELAGIDVRLSELPEPDTESTLAELAEADAAREEARQALAGARTARERAMEDLKSARSQLDRANQADPNEPCPTCGRPMGEDFRQYLAHCRTAVREAKARAQKTDAQLKEADRGSKAAEARLRDAAARGERARSLIQQRAQLAEDAERLRERIASLAEPFGGKSPDVDELSRLAERERHVELRLTELRAEAKHISQAEEDLKKALQERKQCDSRLDRLDREAAALAFDYEEHERRKKERDESRRLLEEARERERLASDSQRDLLARIGELEADIRRVRELTKRVDEMRDEGRYLDRVDVLLKGFRDHLVGRIGPELSREAEALFRDLTNHEYEDLRIDQEDLAIHIADAGSYFGMDRFSGSEVDLANLALRVAISTHLSRVSGADIGMMVLDEVLGSLDAERRDLMVQAMGRLSGRFHQLFVITHAEQVKDHFPASIEVRKVGRRRSTAALV